MEKSIDLRKPVAELVREYPEIKELMVEAGFKEITHPMALALQGKVMTIPEGAKIKNIPVEKVMELFERHGFRVSAEQERS